MTIKTIPYLRVSIAYFVVGASWIVFTDLLVSSDQAEGHSQLEAIQTLKGILFVAITSVLLYLISKSTHLSVQSAMVEKKAVYRKTAEGTQYILNNFLHKMQLVRIEAEEHPKFDRETLDLVNKLIEDAREDVAQLTKLTELSEERIHDTIYRKAPQLASSN